MQSKDLRSILTLGRMFVRSTEATTSPRARMLALRVGRALGASGRTSEFERLEDRKLLDGSFDTPIALPAPGLGGVIVQAGDINPATPGTNNDTYRFTAPASGFVTVLADTVNQTPASNLNTQVQVYNAARQLIASGTTNGTLTSGVVRDGWTGFIATAGQQYFVVVASEGTAAGTYSLRVRTTNQTFSMGGELPAELGIARELNSPVPNFGVAPPILPTAILGQLGGTGAINTRTRQDEIVYRWTVPAGTAYDSIVTLNAQSTITDVTRRLDTRLDVYNSQGVLVTQDSDAGRINDAFTVFRTKPGETYFIRVRSDEITNTNIQLATGPFFLVMDASAQTLNIDDMTRRGSDTGGTFLPFAAPSVAPDPASPNPVFQTGSYSFVAQGSGLAIIVATQRGLAPVSDPALRLYDETGTLIDFRDNSVGLAPQLSVNLEGGRRYFVVVDGFAVASRTQYNLFIEANHTFQTNTIDDHIDAPAVGVTPEERARLLAQATALPWDDNNYVTIDAQDGQLSGFGTLVPVQTALENGFRIERDRGMQLIATGEGRIESGQDRDVFTFTPPADMLNRHTGDNDDAGTSLFLGGTFDSGNPDAAFDVFSQNLLTWDADDYWPVGAQFEADPTNWGFSNNVATAGTPNAEIRVMRAFTMDLGAGPRSFLFVGGDFTLTFPNALGQPVVMDNFAIWAFNAAAGRYEWQAFGGADGPVYAMKQWDVPATGGQPTPSLFIGGDYQNIFTSIGGVAANRLTAIDNTGGFFAPGIGVNRAIRALEVFESFIDDPGTPDFDPESQGERLYIGGDFTNVGANPVAVPALSHLISLDETGTFIAVGPTPNGTVHALQTHIATVGDDIAEEDARLIVGGAFTNFDGPANANLAIYQNELEPVTNFGLPITGPVFAMAPWDPPNINNAPDTDVGLAPKILIGGDFTVGGLANLVMADLDQDGAGGLFFVPGGFIGTNGPVRAIVSIVDTQEPGVDETLRSGTPQAAVYIAGDFTEVETEDGIVDALRVAQLSAFNANPPVQLDAFVWAGVGGGVGNRDGNNDPISVFALAEYDDGNAARWDRHDRPRTRVSMTISPTFGAFFNTRVRVYDSNFEIVYSLSLPGSDSIAPPFPDPSGMVDYSLSAGGSAFTFEGIDVVGGETYYVEISNIVGGDGGGPSGATGRYTVQLRADSGPIDINGDGVREDVNIVTTREVANAGNPIGATQILTTLATGEGSGDRNTSTPTLFPGNDLFNMKVTPSLGVAFSKRGDQGLIDRVDDTDLYFFRAEETGFVEIRVQTEGFTDRYAELSTVVFTQDKIVSSRLDAALRVFDNDLEQITFVDNVTTVGADRNQYVGTFGGILTAAPFRRQDPRAVVRVEAGQVYFFQVESAQRWVNPSAPLPPDAGDPDNPLRRRAIDRKEADGRENIGGYRILVNQVGELASDFENGQFKKDDFPDTVNQGTVIPFANDGSANFAGVIEDTPAKPDDLDVTQWLLPASGDFNISLTVTSGSLIADAVVIDGLLGNNQPIILSTLVPDGPGRYSGSFNGAAGQLVQLVLRGAGTTEGGYTISVTGPTVTDDHADALKWFNATTLQVIDFRGRVEGSGTIEALYDTDTFRFEFDAFQRANFSVRSLDATLVPRLTVYEVSETSTGEAVFLRIGTGVGSRNPNSVNPATALASLQPDRTVEVLPDGPNRTYQYYYVVVEGATGSADFGRYELEVNFTPTDDHADGDSNNDGNFDTGQFASASNIALDTLEGTGTLAGNLELASDSDLFFFRSEASGVSALTITRPTGSLVRARVTVLSSTGVQLAQGSMADVANPTLTLNVNVARGQQVFVVVDSITPNTQTTRTGRYDLIVQAPVADDHPNANEWNIATPIALSLASGRGGVGVLEAGSPGNPRITPDSDSDLFSFTTILSGDQRVTITPLSTSLGNAALRLQIFIASNLTTPLATVDATSINTPVTFNITGAGAGVQYFVLVSSLSGVPDATPRGEYAVQVAGPRPQDPVDPTDPAEIDFDNPTQIILSERTGEGSSVGRTLNPQSSDISPANDRDLYSFVSGGTGRTFVRVWLPQGSLLDAAITVFRANTNGTRTQVAFDADGVAGSTAFTTFGARAGETFFVVVDGLGEATGGYVVEVGSATSVNRLVYPEGFTSDSVFEFVPIVNPNPFPVEYTVRLRYETGDVFETVFATRTIGANTRDGVSINEGTRRTSDVVAGVGYSIIIDWTVPQTNPLTGLAVDPATVQPLGATLSHYDFGSSTGDAFTNRVSDTWTFARVERNPGAVLDFVLFYNPQSYPVDATLRIFFNDGTSTTLDPRRVEGGKRGGFSIDSLQQLGRGVFGATLTAVPADVVLPQSLVAEPFEGIVASLTHYSTASGNTSAFAVLGDYQNGSRAGSVNRFEQGNGISSEITFFNPGLNTATVTLTGAYQRANLPEFGRTVDVPAGRTVRLTGSQLGLLANQPIGLRFSSTSNVAVISQTQTLGDADAATTITSAGTRFLFGDAYINANTAGRNFFETLSFYNPTGAANTIAVNLYFFNRVDQPELGNANPARRTINITIPARGFGELKLHEAPEVIGNRGANNSPDIWFGIETSSVQPFAVTMTHYDLVLGGGWGAAGVPVGLATPLNQILFN